jgi:hypothetical protein
VEVPMNAKKALLFIVLPIILIVAAAAAFWFFYYQPSQNQSAQPGEESQGEESGQAQEEEVPATTAFNGQFVRAQLPQEWTIKEYKNGAGSTMLTSGVTYTGLTGLEIKNPAGKVIFKLQAVYGIGGVGGCDTYFEFDDDSTTYYNSVLAANSEVGRANPSIVDLRSIPYSEFGVFDARVRRIGTNLYWDTDGDATYFEAACGIQEKIFDFGAPQFRIPSMGGTSGIYQFSVRSSATSDELTKMDAILESLEVR